MVSLIKASWDSQLPIYKIPQNKLQRKGIKCLLLDVDGTILNRNSTKIPDKVINWIKKSKRLFSLYLISNNPSEKRISMIGKSLGIKYKFKAFKPSKKITLEAINEINIDRKNIAIIGDRLLTDIFVGNKCKIYSILVKKINREGKPVKFNLLLKFEKLISFFIFK
tara:strand:+ start:64 stop:561 length:498 start_codon:yes stop_codon:yes gene_type:complete